MHLAPDAHDEFDRELWTPLEEHFAQSDAPLDEERFSRFFRDFLMAEGRYVAPKLTFESFEARYEATGFSPKALAKALTASVDYYAVITGHNPDESEAVTEALAGLNALESSTTYPLLLALFERRNTGVIDSSGLAQAIEMLRGFILRRFVCGDSSRGYGQMFVRALARDAGDPVRALETYLLDRGWPHDRQFEAAFEEFPLYERGYAREVLEALERARGHKEPADLRAAEIEHVLPQTLSQAWIDTLGADAGRIHADCLHRPGNLTLSGYNLPLWNHPFGVKRDYYEKSNIVITRELAEWNRWTDVEIGERGRRLAQQAARIWIGPTEQVHPSDFDSPDDEGPGRRELRTRFWTGLSDYLIAEHPDLPGVAARPSWTVRLSSGVHHVTCHVEFNLRHQFVGIDIDFWRQASQRVWAAIRQAPEEFDKLVNLKWQFELVGDGPRARMFLHRPVGDLRDERTWGEAHQWFGEKLSLIYEHIVPRLREEVGGNEPLPGRGTPRQKRSLADLIAGGALQPGMTLFPRRKQHRYVSATLLADGQIDVAGKVFSRPRDAASYIAEKPTNGWWFFLIDPAPRRSLREVRVAFNATAGNTVDDDGNDDPQQ